MGKSLQKTFVVREFILKKKKKISEKSENVYTTLETIEEPLVPQPLTNTGEILALKRWSHEIF